MLHCGWIKNGFRVGFDLSTKLRAPSRLNMPSAKVILEYLASKCCEGRVLGPLEPGQFSSVHRSQFNVIPNEYPREMEINH